MRVGDFIRSLTGKPAPKLRVALIHNDKKISTGAGYINDLMSKSLSREGVEVRHFYPRQILLDSPVHLKGLNNILFFHSLIERRRSILSSSDLIQGTTYTPLAFLSFPIPVVSHFGSTTSGFLSSVPRAVDIEEKKAKQLWYALRKQGAIRELNVRSSRALRDVAEIEEYVAQKADGIIATSKIIKDDLVKAGVPSERIKIIYNAIEDYWFEKKPTFRTKLPPSIIYLGRLGRDAFTLKLKGVDRLCVIFQHFAQTPKILVGMTTNNDLVSWMQNHLSNVTMYINEPKKEIPKILRDQAGSILFISSRYEGFSLSLIEGMSQGLVPVIYHVGVAPEIIRNGVNGYVVQSLREARKVIKSLLSNDSLRLRIARKAYRTATQFTTKKMAKELSDFYAEVRRWYQENPKKNGKS